MQDAGGNSCRIIAWGSHVIGWPGAIGSVALFRGEGEYKMKLIIIRNDGIEEDITQQITDIELHEDAYVELDAEILRELAILMAFNRAAYRAGFVPRGEHK